MQDSLIYFDNAATVWPKPENVYRYMDEFYRSHGVNPGRSGYDLAIETGSLLDRLRKRLTRFFGGDEEAPDRLVFGYNVTDALNLIIPGLVSEGDHIITTTLEHNSVIRPVNHLVRDHGAEAAFVPFDRYGFVDPDDIARAFRPNTKLVVVNHGSNVIGTVQPIAEIGKLCREHGVTFVIDTAQTAGVVPINMKTMNVDVVAFTGHKALMGSMGIGGLCIRKHVEVRRTRSGGTGVRSIHPYHLEEYPWRLEYGTPNLVGIASLWAGQEWLDENGVQQVHEREMKLAQRLVDGFRQIEGVQLYCCDNLNNHLPTILMNIVGTDPGDVGVMLDVDHNIATRTGLHCAPLVHRELGTVERDGGVRFSIGAFNTVGQVDAALAAVSEIARWSRERIARSRRAAGTSASFETAFHTASRNQNEARATCDSWNIGEISYLGDCKDSAGIKSLNARSYRVRLERSGEPLTIEVAVTCVASSYAVDRLQESLSTGTSNADALDAALVRCFVQEELRDDNWDPRNTPWLTIDSDDISEIVAHLIESNAATLLVTKQVPSAGMLRVGK